MSDPRPIGLFDSGLGGLTVLKAVHALLPDESLVYFGDSGRTPYGTKSRETVVKYTFQDIRFLLEQNVKMIVIACNTASACSLEAVRAHFTIPIVEVVEPGARAAVRATRTGRIGVIGTAATIQSGVYSRALSAAYADMKAASAVDAADTAGAAGSPAAAALPDSVSCFGKACPLFVPLVEEGWWDRRVTELTAAEYMQPLLAAQVDTVVLGCTHYPLLQPVIGRALGPSVHLVNSAREVARAVQVLLHAQQLQTDVHGAATLRFFTSDSADKFAALGSVFLGSQLENVTKIDIESR